MRVSEKCDKKHNNNNISDNPLTSRRTAGGKNWYYRPLLRTALRTVMAVMTSKNK